MKKWLAGIVLCFLAAPSGAAWALIGDGVTDETAEIQKMFNDAPNGSVVTFPPGTYLMSWFSVNKNNLTINGDGVTLKRIPNIPLDQARMVRLNGRGITFRGFKIDGNDENNKHLGIFSAVVGQASASQFRGGTHLSAQNGAYVGLTARFTYGNLIPNEVASQGIDGPYRTITAYNGATKEFTVHPPFDQAPSEYSLFDIVDETTYASEFGGQTAVYITGDNVTIDNVEVFNFRTGCKQRLVPKIGGNGGGAFHISGDNARIMNSKARDIYYSAVRLVGEGTRKRIFRLENFEAINMGYKGFSYDGSVGIDEIHITNFNFETDSLRHAQEAVQITNLKADQDFTTVQVDKVFLKNIRAKGGYGQGMKLIGIDKAYLSDINLDVEQDPGNPYYRGGQGMILYVRHAYISGLRIDKPIQIYGDVTATNVIATSDYPKPYFFVIDTPGVMERERINLTVDRIDATGYKLEPGSANYYFRIASGGRSLGAHETHIFADNLQTTGNNPLFCAINGPPTHMSPPNPRFIALGPNITHPGPLYCATRTPLSEIIQQVPNPSAQFPVIALQPSDVQTSAGASAQFMIGVNNPLPLYYQWKRNGRDILGADGPVYRIPNAPPGDNGARYSCHVENFAGQATSNEATLSVSGWGQSGEAQIDPFVNTFNPQRGEEIHIPINLIQPASVKADVVSRQGALVRRLADQSAPIGLTHVTWDGRNERHHVVAAGVYSIVLEIAGKKSTHKVVVLK